MSPASKSKSKEKKAGKEPQKASSNSSGHASTGSGVPASGYNPLLGTFHTIETAPLSSPASIQVNGRFQNIDESDDQSGNLIGTGVEYDSVSNNGSWSGESEEHKEKASQPQTRPEAATAGDNEKQEKIRQKNERKHQRQKERRAQELHERCSSYLMSIKLEALAQQLVAMGFSQERATMALILNEGRVEESVAWLFEGGEEADKHMEHNLDSGSNLKIDISEDLARVADMEIRYKCSKQEVERAVVSCEGDLDKAEETLRVQKQDPPSAPPKPEENGDPPTAGNSKLPAAASHNLIKVQPKPPSVIAIQPKKDEKDFNYTKAVVTSGSLVDPGSKNLPSLKRIPPKMDWAKPQQIAVPAEKRWPVTGSNPSVSYSLASSLQPSLPPAKNEPRYVAVGNELKNLQIGSVREPVIMMQRPQCINGKQTPSASVSSSSPGTALGWYPNGMETLKPNGMLPTVSGARSPSPSSSSKQLYNQFQYHQPQQQFVSSSGALENLGIFRGNALWSRVGASPAVAPATNLGLFSGLGINGLSWSSSPVDWSTGGSMTQLDYTNVDWTLDRGSSISRPGGLLPGMNSFMHIDNPRTYDSFSSGIGVRSAMRPVLSNGNGVSIPGLQDGVGSAETSKSASREWTSPFEEKDLFSLPRQFVSSPSL